MITQSELLLVAGMTLVTFGVRYPVLALVSRIPLPRALLDALKFIPPAVLAALILPTLLAPNGGPLQLNLANDYLVAGSIAALVAWRSHNLLATLGIGMAALWLWRWLVSLALFVA
jgi:branched-subunit amino acid transport protein